jgi:hypothetical protein
MSFHSKPSREKVLQRKDQPIYRDDGLAIINNKSTRLANKIKFRLPTIVIPLH